MIKCKNKTDSGVCKIVSGFTGEETRIDENACVKCIEQDFPMSLNMVTANVAMSKFLKSKTSPPEELENEYRKWHPLTNRREGLGDWTEQQLKSIGVTPGRYKAAKELFGLSPTCDCEGRKQWLNSVSDWWRGK